jgi:predicted nucleic acid-binding protein
LISVSDTSPLNYLIWIEEIRILPLLFDRILVPEEVVLELRNERSPAKVRNWAATLPRWIEVRRVSGAMLESQALVRLDAGERAAIALAADSGARRLLVDERRGTAVAEKLGITCTGTLGVLDQAAASKHLRLPEAIQRLASTSFRFPPQLIRQLLANDAKRR